jgi:LuxR family maltose regulon positive regulatory protein
MTPAVVTERPRRRAQRWINRVVEAPAQHEVPLFESKLTAPLHQMGSVPRTGLVNRLRAARTARLVLVSAPAGYGKTTLVAEWARRDGRPFAWYSVDASDKPAAFAGYLSTALIRAVRGPPGGFGAEASSARPDESIALLGRLLASSGSPVVLVVDGVDQLRDPASAQLLARFVDELPPPSQLVLVSRAAAPLPLARLRAQGGLVELDAADLSFADREAAALLRAAGVELARESVEALNAAVEGWPAGLHLAALALGSSSNGADPARAGDELMLDYFRTKLLPSLPPDDVQFLTRSSVLESMCGTLCDVVTQMPGSAERLARLERSNLFVVPLDREGRSYRLHIAFRKVLAIELERREPGVAGTLRGRAATWCAEYGSDELALEYARSAGDRDRLVELLERSAPFSLTAQPAKVGPWLDALDDAALLQQHPAAAAIGALTLALTGHPEVAERWAGATEQAAHTHVPAPWQALLHSMMNPHGAEDMRTHAARALDRLPLGSAWRAPALLVLACAHALEADSRAVDRILGEAADTAASAGAATVESAALAYGSLLSAEGGDWARADALADAARRVVRGSHLEDSATTLSTLAPTPRAALRKGDWTAVRADLEGARALLPRLTYAIASFSVLLRIEFARVHLALGDANDALLLLDEVDEIFSRRPRLGLCHEDSEALRAQVEADLRRSRERPTTLTAAELRLLPLLTTHLSFREIATRLYVSRNTVKSQAISVYRKLGVSSRRDAIVRASELGLVAGSAAEKW